MLNSLENFYLQKEEPVRSCLLALRDLILSADPEVAAAWKYGMPFFCFKGKMFCYLWVNRKKMKPYIGFVEGTRLEHPRLLAEKRSRMKVIEFDAGSDLPLSLIKKLLKDALALYKNGTVSIK